MQRSTRKKKSRCFDDFDLNSFKIKNLPDNFAESLMNLEFEMTDPKVSLNSINSLIGLYAEAVEYYESVQSNRYIVFQKKLQDLLQNSHVIAAMSRGEEVLEERPGKQRKSETFERDEPIYKEPVKRQYTSPQKQEMEKVIEMKLKEEDTDSNVRKMLNSVELNLQTMKNLVNLETSKQKDAITARLANRKAKIRKLELQKPDFANLIQSNEEIMPLNDPNLQIVENFSKIIQKRESISVLNKPHTLRSFDTDAMMESNEFSKRESFHSLSPNVQRNSKNSIIFSLLRKDSIDVERRISRFSGEGSGRKPAKSAVERIVIQEMRQSGSEDDSSSSSEEIKIDREEERNENDKNLVSEAGNKMINLVKEDQVTELVLEKNYEERLIEQVEKSLEEELVQSRQEEIIEMESPVIGDKIEPEIEKEVINLEVNEKLESEGKNEEIVEIGSSSKEFIVNDEKLEEIKDDIGGEKIIQINESTVINNEKGEEKEDKETHNQDVKIAEIDELVSKADENKKEDLDINKDDCKDGSTPVPFVESSYEEHKLFEPETVKPIELPLEKIEQPKYNEQIEKIEEIHIEPKTKELFNNDDSQISPLIQKNAALIEEREEKIKSIKHRFSPQITNLENQMKASKGKGLISKLLEKVILEQQKQINQINQEYEHLLNSN